jgi:lipopolysaccharide export system protein LptA
MPLAVYRLRRWLAAIAILFTVVIAWMYLSVRLRQRNVLKEVPNKIGIDIKQTATGFQFSKSEGGRTLFTIQASNLREFKLNGRAELHNVSIILYGRDSSRFDQIYGDDFAYDPKSGDITAKGEVQIDLEANPAGSASADQSPPKELKNPIHLHTRDLVFNKESGNASTAARVEFRTPQATGSAIGVSYVGKTNTLTLQSQVHAEFAEPDASVIEARRGIVTRDPRQVVLEHVRLIRGAGVLQADQATHMLGRENNVERVLANGNVNLEAKLEPRRSTSSRARKNLRATAQLPPNPGRSDQQSPDQQSSDHEASATMLARADEADLLLTGKRSFLQTATLRGNVQVKRVGFQPLEGDAGRATLEFAGENQLQKVHADQSVRLIQENGSQIALNADNSPPQNFELTAPAIDFLVSQGRRLDRAQTLGRSQITISSAQSAGAPKPPEKTVVTAGKFEAHFEPLSTGSSRLAAIHGAPDAKIVNSSPGQPERISTSQSVDAIFLPQGGVKSISQQGAVCYTDGQIPGKRVQAWADNGRYTPADQMLLLTGNPRVATAGMSTTGNTIRMDRATGEAIADGNVKSTYTDLKEQAEGALLASSSPIHITSSTMTAHHSPAIALYTGKARLWQDANIIEAPSIQFDRDRRSVTAQGTASEPVSTILLQPGSRQAQKGQKVEAATPQKRPPPVEKPAPNEGKQNSAMKADKTPVPTPIALTGRRLTYVDAERKAHYEGGVVAKGADITVSADTADVYLMSRQQGAANPPREQPGTLDRLVAQGHVVILQPNRRAEGQTLVYTASDDKFVLTGGPPSIFDAEQGKITGVSLTFFRRDDRVLVEGEATTPVITQTRVAR